MSTTDGFSKLLATIDNVSVWTSLALMIGTAFILYWPYNVGVDLSVLRKEAGIWLFAIMVISASLVTASILKKLHHLCTYTKRKPRDAFHFTPTDLHCWWSSAKQKDGRVFTQLVADCNVLNLTDNPLFFHSVKLVKPKIPKKEIIHSDIAIFRANTSSIDYIPPFETSKVRANFHVKIPIARKGKTIKMVMDVIDRFGNNKRIKLRLRDINVKL